MILRLATRPDLGIFSNNEAEQTIRRSKSSSAAPEAAGAPSPASPNSPSPESYLPTATKWGISKLDALRGLFNGNAWMPPGPEPAG